MKYIILALSLLLLPFAAHAEHPTSFSKAKKLAAEHYKGDEKTFYCGCTYHYEGKKLVPDADSCGYEPRVPITKKGNPNSRATRIEWEHVMPAWVFGHQRQCWQEGGRKACKKDAEFNKMEADLHNLVPAVGELNGDRSNYKFGMIPGEPRAYGACDFEVDFKGKVAEPMEAVRGDIARVYFYMRDQYGLKLSKQQTLLLEVWAKADPVSDEERARNERIAKIQGNANPWIK
ncbi:endonuclease [Terasakiella pusilla]|uniref:endonuclease n=1 Tax=Terasakiella pusilla TaxID=64973 RepID=UPI003AA81036